VIRIAGVNIPNKRVVFALPVIYGIGRARALKVLQLLHIDPEKKAEELTAQEVNALKEVIEKNYRVEGELRREIMLNVKRLKDINSYRGIRHSRGLPVRGQRTRTNSRTRRGNVRRTMGSGRRPSAEKT